MHIDLMFPSQYLKTADLRGRDVTLTVRHVVRQEVRSKSGGAEKKWCMYFEETRSSAEKAGNADEEKRLIFRVTVARQIAKATGQNDCANWAGHRITLYPSKDNSYGETKDCIRVRETAAAPSTAADVSAAAEVVA